MTDPERLLSPHSDADPLERALLGSLHRQGPSAAARDEAWQAIAASMGTLAAAGAVAGHAAPGGAGSVAAGKALGDAGLGAVTSAMANKALLAKLVMFVMALGAAGVGTSLWLHRTTPPAPVTLPSPATHDPPLPMHELPPAQELPAASCGTPGALPCPSSEPEAPRPRGQRRKRPELLLSESRLVTLARAELRGGNVAAARTALERLRAHFPHGKLGQERDVLSIELYAAEGRSELAKRRAQAFIAAHPESPHSARLAHFVDAH